MAEYIEREAAIKAFENADSDVMADYGPEYGTEWGFSRDAIRAVIGNIPAANVAPVVYGEWIAIEKWASKAQYKCSVCGRRIMASLDVAKVMGKYPYCNCGAKM